VFVDERADDHGLTVGSPVSITTPSGTKLDLTVKGIFDPPSGGSFGNHVLGGPRQLSDRGPYSFVTMDGVTDANT
jgi:hypothetical protein